MPHHRHTSHTRAGAALVELALVLPILFLFFVGIVEVSRILLLQHSIDTAAYEGARAGMVPGATAAEAKAAAVQLLTAARLKDATISIDRQSSTKPLLSSASLSSCL